MNATMLSDDRDAEKGAWKSNPIEKCWDSSLEGGRRSILNASTWHTLREKYVAAVGEEESTISLEQDNGFLIPYEIKHAAERGRGVYATSIINIGDHVWQPIQHAVFRKEEDFRFFLSNLSHELACDVLMWAYVESCDCHKVGMNGKKSKANLTISECYAVTLELDDASLINSIKFGEEQNIFFIEEASSSDESSSSDGSLDGEFAIRIIKPGEEIVTDYSTFDMIGKLKWFDAMVGKAWGIEIDAIEDDWSKMVRGKKPVEDRRFCNISIVPLFLLCMLYFTNMRNHALGRYGRSRK